MPEPMPVPPQDQELMYSPPPPTHPLRKWYSERFPRLLAGLAGMCLIAILALGLILLCRFIMLLLFPPFYPPFH